MERTVVVRGTLRDPSHIELEEPVPDIHGPVEVTLRSIQETELGSPLVILQALRALPDIEAAAVDELERMIETGKLRTRPEGLFDAEDA